MLWSQLQQGQKLEKPMTSHHDKVVPTTQPPGPHVNGHLLCPPPSWLKQHAASTTTKSETQSAQDVSKNSATPQKPAKVGMWIGCCSSYRILITSVVAVEKVCGKMFVENVKYFCSFDYLGDTLITESTPLG